MGGIKLVGRLYENLWVDYVTLRLPLLWLAVFCR